MFRMATDKQGNPLPKNLYSGEWGYRYKLADGRFKTVKNEEGKLANYELACAIADKLNSMRSLSAPSIKTIAFWLEKYVVWAEQNNPTLIKKDSWRYRKSELTRFADEFSHINLSHLTLNDLRDWWDGMTYDQQHNRRSAFSKFFQFCMSNGICSLNPFTTADNAPRLFEKFKPAKKRDALEIEQFWAIYHSEHIKKYPHVKIAMGISLLTGMREEDVCLLRFDTHIIDNRLCLSIGKSVGQRGTIAAAHHGYDLDQHLMLKQIINDARELSLKHRRCPYILSYHPRGREQMGDKKHISQVRPKKLSRDFKAVVSKCELTWKPGKTPATFHEVKGLFINRGLKFYSAEQMQKAAAHIDVSTTLAYPANHAPVFDDIAVVMTEEIIGGRL